jgi:hypothetical protein
VYGIMNVCDIMLIPIRGQVRKRRRPLSHTVTERAQAVSRRPLPCRGVQGLITITETPNSGAADQRPASPKRRREAPRSIFGELRASRCFLTWINGCRGRTASRNRHTDLPDLGASCVRQVHPEDLQALLRIYAGTTPRPPGAFDRLLGRGRGRGRPVIASGRNGARLRLNCGAAGGQGRLRRGGALHNDILYWTARLRRCTRRFCQVRHRAACRSR